MEHRSGDRRVRSWLREESGASASEYAILVAIVAVAIYVAVIQFNLGNIFLQIANVALNCVSGSGC